ANPAHNCSQIDVDAVDAQAFPQFGGARRYRATLRAGDLLFIPAWWFHAFFHEGEFNSNVNFWWKPELPRMNPVAARQALIDIVARAGVGGGADSPDAALLARLDRAAVDSEG